jgi:hypothetical protein
LVNFKKSFAKDFYGLSNCILKQHKNDLVSPITDLINDCINKGEFPSDLKVAVVKPIFKNGDKTDLTNYRPIAMIPIVSKIVEYVLQDRLKTHLKNNNLMSDHQFGFTTRSNTEIAVIHLISQIYQNIDDKKYTACVFLDLSKAFDCLDHGILLYKINKLQVSSGFKDIINSNFEVKCSVLRCMVAVVGSRMSTLVCFRVLFLVHFFLISM